MNSKIKLHRALINVNNNDKCVLFSTSDKMKYKRKEIVNNQTKYWVASLRHTCTVRCLHGGFTGSNDDWLNLQKSYRVCTEFTGIGWICMNGIATSWKDWQYNSHTGHFSVLVIIVKVHFSDHTYTFLIY